MKPRGTFDERDDLDQLFTRLHPAVPPSDLKARILRALPADLPVAAPMPRAAVGRAASSNGSVPWRWIAVGAGVLLAIMSVRLGNSLDDSGAFSVLSQMFGDFGTFMAAPGDYLAPLVSELPWFDIIIALAALVTFWVSSSASVDQAQGRGTRQQR